MIKQVIILRRDLNMSTGKAVVQGAHASETSVKHFMLNKPNPDNRMEVVKKWNANGRVKIVLACNDLNHLDKIINKAKEAGLPYSMITDEGRTEFNKPTTTCGAIGPASAKNIDKITKRLRLY